MSEEEGGSGCRDGSLDIAEPVAKRTRSAIKKLLEPEKPKEEGTSNVEPTILDILNEDCWKVILDYVKIKDLVLSERVSRHWRSVILRYLQGVRVSIRFSYDGLYEAHVPFTKHRTMGVPQQRYVEAVKKLGRSIVEGYCCHVAHLRLLWKNCPGIEVIKIQHPQYHTLKSKIIPFNTLKRISIVDVHNFNDQHIAKFLSYTTLEKLEVNINHKMTGACFMHQKINLNCLELQSCRALNMDHLASAFEWFKLRKLELNSNPLSVLENVHKLLERTPNLEHLGLVWYETTGKVGPLVEAICGLSMLKHLNLYSNNSVNDKWLEDVGRCCGQLKTVSVGDCEDVTAAGIVALCRGAGRTLIGLDASCNEYITEEDVARCIRYCPKLEVLNVQYSPLVARNLPAVAAAVRAGGPRARPLRLHLSKLAFNKLDQLPMESCPGLIVDFDHNTFRCGEIP